MSSEPTCEEELFKAARRLDSPEAQQAYLTEACGGDPSLLARVQALLASLEQAEGFLESPPVSSDVTLPVDSLAEAPGTVIGHYKLLEKIGEGGMAVVYMAQQERPIRRKVALKIIKLGMDTRQVIARFEAERQALALMDHPNIAKVLDAGATDTGRPYFVMELVTGVSITEYCDQNTLCTRERLGLFMQVCNAVQHAHQKGIIHRDLKPSNVLVTQHEGKPVPKVIDFGIAKATNQRLTEKTLFTRYAHIIGTPAYMSPEQAELSDIDIDTRSDIYSLGVLLYELLTGTTPFSEEELRKAGYAEMTRVIREHDPVKPSTKLIALGATATKTAQHHNTSPVLLLKIIRGDLDWITMKCLEKDRGRRYDSAGELVSDIGRYIDDDIVLARPPRVAYRIKKFVRRHHVMVSSIAFLLVVLTSGMVIVGVFAYRAAQSQKETLALASFLQQDIFGTLDPRRDAGRRVTVEELLDTASERVETKLRDQPIVAASIHKTLGMTFHGLGELNRAEFHLKRSLDIFRQWRGEDDPLALEALQELGYLYFFQREPDKAEEVLKKSLATSRRVLGNRHRRTLGNMYMLGTVMVSPGQQQEAELLLDEALDACEQVLGPSHEYTLACLGGLALRHKHKGDYNIAERLLMDMLYMRQPGPRNAFAEGNPDRLHFLTYLAWVYCDQGRSAEARELAERVVEDARNHLGQAHRETVFAMVIMSIIYESEERYDAAEGLLLQALEIRRREATTQPDWRWPEFQLGQLYLHQNRYQEAHNAFVLGIETHIHSLGESHWLVRWTIDYCANLWKQKDKSDWANQYLALLPEEEGESM